MVCTDNCVLRKGVSCMYAIAWIIKCNHFPEDYVPVKFTVLAGLKALKKSYLHKNSNRPLDIEFTNLEMSNPRIIPPHTRAPRGRPKKKGLQRNNALKNL